MQMWYARNAGRRGFSLVEMVAVLVIVSILAGAGWAGYGSVRANIQQTQTRDLLRSVADAQQAQYRSRGAFVASSATEMARVATNEAGYAAPDANIASSSANTISAAAGQAYGSIPVLGLAAWSKTGDCLMSATFAPASGRKSLEGKATKSQLDARALTCNGIGALAYLRVSDQPTSGSVPNAPSSLSVAAGPGQLNLAWSAAATGSPATGFRIYRAASPSTDFTFLADVVSSSSYTDTGLNQNVSYTYRLVAYNGAGQSAASSTATAKPLDPATTTPTRPLNVTADPVQATAVTLTWKPVAGAVGYKVFRNGLSVALLDPSDANADGFATGTSFTDFAVAPGAKYNYRVDAYNVVGPAGAQQMLWSAPYAGVNVVTPPAAVPAVVANAKAGVGEPSCETPACVLVSWNASPATAVGGSVPDAEHLAELRGYKVYRCDGPCPPTSIAGPQPTMTMAASVNATTTTIVDSALPGSAPYAYRVYAVNERGLSTSSVEATTRTAAAAVDGVSVVPAGTGKAKISWASSAPAGATLTGYRVYKKDAAGDLTQVAAVSAGTTTFTDTGLPGFAEVTYVVAAVTTAEGVGLPSTPQTVVTDPAPLTGITYTATESAVSLTWSRAKGITYTVLRDDVAVGTTTVGEYTDESLAAGTSYSYKVRATNTAGGTATSAALATWTRPSAPTGVSAAPTGDQVKLTWTPAPGATSYHVLRCVGGSCDPDTDIATTAESTFTDAGLSLGTNYSYKVTASNTAGSSSSSATVSAATKPNAVTLSVSANPKQVNLTWTAAPTATSYAIYRDGSQIATVNSDLKFTDSNVTGGFVYAYQVYAVNDAGRSLSSNTATTSTAPYAPTGLAANTTATTATLTWVSSGSSKYQVYRCAGVCQPGEADLVATINSGSTKTYTDTGLTALGQYTYSVKAGNGTGWSEVSSPLTVRTTLLAPSNLRLTGQSSTTIDLAWDAADGAGGYRIYRDGSLVTTIGSGATTTATLTGLAPGTQYSLTISSYTTAGESTRSAPRVVITNLDAPTDLRVVSATAADITLQWAPSAGAASYKVARCTGDTCTPTTVVATVNGGASTAYTDTSVSANTAYRYSVVATTTDATSANSNVIVAWTRPGKPAAPVLASVTDSSATLQWSPVANSVGYRIYRDGVLAGQTAAGVTDFTDGGRNLLNPVLASVEADTTGFTPANLTRVASGEQSWHGSYSLKLTPNSSGSGTWTTVGLGDTGGMRAGLTAGKTYTFSTYTYVPVGGVSTATPAIIFKTSGASSYAENFSTDVASPNGTWQRQTVTVTLPANTTEAFLRLYHGGAGTDTRSVYFDGIQLEEGSAATDFQPGAMTGGTSYDYTLTVLNAGGESVPSNVTAALLKPAPPAPPTTTGQYRAAKVDWTAVTSATSYVIQRCTGPSCSTFTQVGTVTAPQLTFTNTGLSDNTTYGYRVIARSSAGDSSPSPTGYALTLPQLAAAPTFTAISSTGVQVNWASVPGGTAYRLYRVGVSSPIYDGISTSFVVTGLAAGTSYSFNVASGNTSGYNTVGPDGSVTTVPAAPTGLSETHTDTTITFTWAATVGADDYKVYLDGTLKATVTGSTSTTLTGLTPATAYALNVSAANTSGEGPKSSVLNVTTRPVAPVSVTATAPSRGAIKLTWGAVAGANAYTVYRAGVAVGGCAAVSTLTCTVTGLADATSYTFTVTATGAGGDSVTSNPTTMATLPAPPTALTKVMSGTTASLSWTAPAGTVTGYKVYRCAGVECTPVFVANSAGTSYSDTGLAMGTTYTWTVTALTSGGESAQSDPTSGTTVHTPVTGLAVNYLPGEDTKLVVTWDAKTPANLYSVYRCEGLCTPASTDWLATVGGGTTTFTDTGLNGNTTYSYSVTAQNEGGYSARPASRSGLTPPSAPTGLRVTGTTPTTLSFAWNAPATAVTSTRIWYYPSTGGSYSVDVAYPATTATVSTGVAGDTAHTVRIHAVNSSGASPASSDVTATSTVATPTALSVTGTNTTTASLSWAAVDGADTYKVYRAGSLVGSTNLTTYTNTGLTPGTAYSYEVSAFGATSAFESAKAGPVTATTTIPAPTLNSATGGTKTVALTWSASTGAVSYSLYRCTGTCATGAATLVGNVGNVTSYTNTGLGDGTTYTYHVIANGSAATSLPSNQISALTVAAIPTGVAGNPGATSVVVTWNSADGTKYDVFRCAGVCTPTVGDLIASINNGSTQTYTDTGLTSLAQYTYTVRAGNASGWSAMSSPVTVRTILDMPGNVRTTAVTGTTISLAWDTSSGATGYRVYNGAALVADIPGGGSTTTTLTNLTPGTAYQLSMSAYSTAGESGKTTALSVNTTLDAPTNLVAGSSTTTSVALTWDAVDGATGYQVLRCNTSSSCTPTTVVATTSGNGTTTVTNTGLSANTRYRYAVKATSAATASVASAVVDGWTVPAKPAAPTLSNITNTGATVTWPTVPNATSYQVYRDGALAGTTDGSTTSFTDGGRNMLDPATANIEAGAGQVTAFSSTNMSVSTDQPWRGTSSLKVITGGVNNNTIVSVGGDAGGLRAGMVPGKSYIASAYTNIPAGGSMPRLYLLWKTPAGTQLNYSIQGQVGVGWNRIQVAATIPADATEAYIRFYTNQTSSATVPTYVDGFQLEEGTGTDGFTTGSTNLLTGTTATQESGLGTLAGMSGLTATSSTEQAWQGTRSAKLVPNGVNNTTYASIDGDAGAMRSGMQPGHMYNFSAWLYSPTGGTAPRVYIYWRSGTGSTLNNSSAAAVANDTWQRLEVSALIPADATEAFVRVIHSGTSTTTTPVYVDGLKLEDVGAPSEFSPGAMTGGTNHSWTVSVSNPAGESAQSNSTSALLTPDAPTNITTTGASKAATVTWDAATSATSYKVQRCTGVSCSTGWTTVATLSSPTLTFTNSALADGTTYGYRVLATNATGDSPASVTSYALTLPAIAGAPTFTAVTATTVTVNWAAATGATAYRLYRTGVGSPLYDGPATSFTVTGLSAGTAYTFNVASGNTSGYNAVGASANVTTVPATPTGLAETHTHNTADLTWTAVTGATSYKVYLNGTYQSTVASASATLTGLSPTTAYSVKVSAVNASGESAQSSAVAFTTSPVPPTTPTYTAPSAGTIALSWTAASGATSYTAYRDGVAISGCVNITTLTCSVNGLANATTYSFTISVTDSQGGTSSSNPLSATTLPAAPTGLVANMSGTTANLTWTTTPGAVTGYKVYRCTSTSCTTAFIANAGTNSYANTGLATGTTYTWQVTAVTAGGEGPKSTAVTGSTVNPAPSGLSATGVSYSDPAEVTLDWSALPNTTRYGVYRCTGTCAPTTANWVAWVSTGTTTYTDANLTHGVEYSWAVASENAAGLSPLSSPSTLSANHAPLSGVTVTDRTATTITIGWNPAPTPHNVFSVWLTASGSAGVNQRPVAGSTSVTFTGLNPDTSLYADLYVSNSGGWSKATRVNSATVVDSPTGLTMTGKTSSSVSLSWTGSAGAASYRVYRNGTLIGSPTGTTYTDNTATAGNTYSYEVAAYGSTSAFTSAKAGPVAVSVAPDAPVLVSATPLADGRSSVTLTWNAATGATSYSLYRCVTSCAPAGATLVANVGNVTSYTNYDLSSGTTYMFHLVSNSAAGTSGASNQKTALTTPGATTNLRNTATDDTVIALAWNGPTGQVDTYTLTRNGSTIANPTGSTYNDTLAWSGSESTRAYVVSAKNASGSGSTSSLTVARPPAVTATGGTARIDLSWAAVPSATKYTVWSCAGTGACNIAGAGTDVAGTTFALTGLATGATYTFAVTATIGGVASAPDRLTAKSAPAAPTGLTATAAAENAMDLSWTASPSATGYDVYRGGLLVGSTTGATTFTDSESSRLPECVTKGGDCAPTNKLTGWTAVGSTLSVLWSDGQDADSGWLATAVRAKLPARTGAGSTDLAYATFAVTAGEPINVEGYARNDQSATGVQAQMRIVWYNSSNAVTGTAVTGTTRALAAQGDYRRLTAVGVAPAGATSARAYLTQVASGAVAATDLFTDRWYAGAGPIADTSYSYTVVATNPASSPVSSAAATYTAPSAPKRANFDRTWDTIRSHAMPLPWDSNTATSDQYQVRWCTHLSNDSSPDCDITAGTVEALTSATSFTLTDARDNWIGSAQVRTRSAASSKYSAWSNTVTASSALPAPTNLKVNFSWIMTATWNIVNSASSYGLTVRRGDGTNPSWWSWPCTPAVNDFDNVGDGYTTSCDVDPGEVNDRGTRFTAEVVAKSPYRNSDAATAYWWTRPAATAATGVMNTVTTATLSWAAVPGATSYKVYSGSGFSTTLLGTTSSTSYGVTTGYSRTGKDYVVTAVLAPPVGEYGGGEGPQSNVVTLWPATNPVAPTTDNSHFFDWSGLNVNFTPSNSTVTKVEIYRSVNGAALSIRATINDPQNTQTWKDTIAQNGNDTYEYVVVETNAAGRGTQSPKSTPAKVIFEDAACSRNPFILANLNNGPTGSTSQHCTVTGAALTMAGTGLNAPRNGSGHDGDAVKIVATNSPVDVPGGGPTGNGNGTWALSYRYPNTGGQPNTTAAYFFSQGGTGTSNQVFGLRPHVSNVNALQAMYYTTGGVAEPVTLSLADSGGTVTNVLDGDWHDIVLTKSALTLTLYVDGKQRGSGTMPSTPALLNTKMRLAGWTANSSLGRIGHYDDFTVFTNALSSAEVSNLYYSGDGDALPWSVPDFKTEVCAKSPAPLFLWSLNDRSAAPTTTTAQNACSAGVRTGTYAGSPTADLFNGPGHIRGALTLDSTDDTVSTTATLPANTNATYALSYKANTIPAVGTNVYFFSAGGTNGVGLRRLGSATALDVVVGGSGPSALPITLKPGTDPLDGKWHDIVLVKSSTTYSLYIDGVLQGSVTSANTVDTAGFKLATWINGSFQLQGDYDDPAVFPAALSATDVAGLYTAGQNQP